MNYCSKKINLLIVISFFFSLILGFYYIDRYDDYSKYKNNKHPMIKTAVENSWYEANLIIRDYKEGKNFFNSGKISRDEFLPPIILAFYYLIMDEAMYEGEIIKVNNKKFLYIFFKIFFYYFCLYWLSNELKNLFSEKLVFYTIAFLALLPDIAQYHSSFWNEGLFFPFQIMVIFFVIKQSRKPSDNIFLAVSASCLYLISQEYLLYFFIIILYLIFRFKKNSLSPLIYFLCTYFIIFGGSQIQKFNEANTKNFGLKSATYLYLAPRIVSEKEKVSIETANQILKKEALNWAAKENLSHMLLIKNSSLLLNFEDNSTGKEKYLNYMLKTSLFIILENPIIVLKIILKSTLHLITLNPFYIHYFYEYSGKGDFLKTEIHKNLIPVRIIYSLILYSIIIIGFYKFTKISDNSLSIYFLLSIMYVVFTMGWMGTPRYFVPAIIFSSIFFGSFFEQAKKQKNNNRK